jgi:hypothetical protein
VNHVVLSVSVSPNLVITYRVEHLGGCLGQGGPESLSSSGHPSFSQIGKIIDWIVAITQAGSKKQQRQEAGVVLFFCGTF